MKRLKSTQTLIVLLSFLLVAWYVGQSGGGFPLDDSWIHQTYARNLGWRGEWSFIQGEYSAASTAPLYTLLLALGYTLRIPFVIWTHLLGAVALSGLGVATFRYVRQHAHIPTHEAGWVALNVILTWQLIWFAGSGMETLLFSWWAFIALLMVLKLNFNQVGSAFRFGIWGGMGVLIRPEAVVLLILVMLVLIWQNRHSPLVVIRWGGLTAIVMLCILLPYLLFNWQMTGGLLPSTSTAKQREYAILLQSPLWWRVWVVNQPLWVGGQMMLLPGLLAYFWVHLRTDKRLSLWLAPLWCGALILLYALRLPVNYQHGRYVIPVLPLLIMMGTLGTFEWVRRGRTRFLTRVLSRAVLAIAFITSAIMGGIIGVQVYTRDVAIIQEEMVMTAQWIEQTLPTDALLATHDIGAVGYFAPRPILDLAGLISPEVIPLLGNADGLWDLLEGRSVQYLMAFADQIPNQDPSDPRLCEVYRSQGKTSPGIQGPSMTVYRLAFPPKPC